MTYVVDVAWRRPDVIIDVQNVIESRADQGRLRAGRRQKMLTFMDDFNMPSKDVYGSQPPLELIRLWLDYGFSYDHVRQTVRYIRVSSVFCRFDHIPLS